MAFDRMIFRMRGERQKAAARVGQRLAVCAAAVVIALPALTAPQLACASVQVPGPVEAQQHYDQAFQFQDEGQIAQADEQHRLFLAVALHHVANARATLGQYAKAAPVYDEALVLAPNDTALRMDYAGAALDGTDWKRARNQAAAVLEILKNKGEPANPAALTMLAQSMMAAGAYKDAVEQFKLAAAVKPSFDTSCALAGAYLALGNKAEAVRIFAALPGQYGDSADLHAKIGRLYGQAAYYDEAIQEFHTAIDKDAALPGAHYSIAATLMMLSGESAYSAAEPELRLELAIDANDPLVYVALGRIQVVQRRYGEAEVSLKRALELDDSSTAAHALLGQLYTAQNRDAEAEAAFRRQIELTLAPAQNDFEVQRAHFNLGRLLAKGGDVPAGHREMDISRDLLLEKERGFEARLRGNALQPSLPARTRPVSLEDREQQAKLEAQAAPMMASSYDNLGVHAAVAGNFNAAEGYFKQAAHWNPGLPGIDRKWGRAAFAAGDFAGAAEPLSHALTANPADERVRTMLALSRFAQRDYAATVRLLQPIEDTLGAMQDSVAQLQLAYLGSLAITGDAKSLTALTAFTAAHPESAEGHRLLGEAYGARKQCAQAHQELQMALHLDPSLTNAQYGMALNEMETGNKAAARKLFAEMARSGSRDADVHFRLAQLDMEAGAPKDAVQSLETAVELSPRNAAYHRELAKAYSLNERAEDAEAETEKSAALETEEAAAAPQDLL